MAAHIFVRDIQTGLIMAWHDMTKIVEKITRENSGIAYDMEMRALVASLPKGTLVYPAGFDANNNARYTTVPPTRPESVKEKDWNAPSPVALGDSTYVETGSQQLFALDDNLPIGPAVNDTYGMVSNSEMWDVIETGLAGTTHKIVSAGSVEDRTKVFVSVEMGNGEITAAGRKTSAVLNFLWGHGGKLAVKAKTGFTVVVCANTLAVALREKGEFNLGFKHTKNAKSKLEGMAEAVKRHFAKVEEFVKINDRLADVACTDSRAREIFTGLIMRPAKLSDFEPAKMSTRSANQVDALVELFSNKKQGNDGINFADLLNAVTDYYTHANSGGDDKWRQFVSSEFGAGQSAKEDFYRLLGGTVSDKAGDKAQADAELATLASIGAQTMAMG